MSIIEELAHASVTTGRGKVYLVVHTPGPVFTVRLAGQVMTGGV